MSVSAVMYFHVRFSQSHNYEYAFIETSSQSKYCKWIPTSKLLQYTWQHSWRGSVNSHFPTLLFIWWWQGLQAIMSSAAAAKSLQSCPTLWDLTDGSPTGSPVPGILQARTLEWVAISFSNAWKWKAKVKLLSYVRLLATSWTVAYPAPISMRFSRQEHWSGLPVPSLQLCLNCLQCKHVLKAK